MRLFRPFHIRQGILRYRSSYAITIKGILRQCYSSGVSQAANKLHVLYRGGLIITRVYLYYPSLVAGLFSAGTPYLPPEPRWLEWDKYAEKFPTFKYQKHFGSTELELQIQTREAIRQFFIAGYYGRGPNGEMPFSTEGALVCNWPLLIKSEVLTDEVCCVLCVVLAKVCV